MGLINGGFLSDGSYLVVCLGTDRRAWALIEYPDGKREGWTNLDAVRQFTSMPDVTVSGSKAVVDALSFPSSGSIDSLDDWWSPYRNVYQHDRTKPFLNRFSGWKPLGDPVSRLRPTIPPLP